MNYDRLRPPVFGRDRMRQPIPGPPIPDSSVIVPLPDNEVTVNDVNVYSELVELSDWDEISANSDLSITFIERFKESLNWTILTQYRMFSEDELNKYKNYIDWIVASRYQKLTIELIENNIDDVDFNYISMYQTLTPEFIHRYHNYVNWDYVSKLQTLTNYIIQEHSNQINWIYASAYQNISDLTIRQNEEKVDWAQLSKRKLTLSFIDEFKDRLYWKYIGDSEEKKLGIEFINSHLSYVNWHNVSMYETLTNDFIITNANNVDWEAISMSQTLPESTIRTYANDVNWDNISRYQTLTLSFITEFASFVNWEMIAKYQSLTEEYVETNIDRFYPYMDILLDREIFSAQFTNKYKYPVQIKALSVTVADVTVDDEVTGITITVVNNTGWTGTYMYKVSDTEASLVYGEHISSGWTTFTPDAELTGVILESGDVVNVAMVDSLNFVTATGHFDRI